MCVGRTTRAVAAAVTRPDNRRRITMPTRDSAKASGTIDDASIDLAALDTSRPNIARVYDYWLGGIDNFAADREEAERMLGVYPELALLARENRLFLSRAVAWLAEQGVRQPRTPTGARGITSIRIICAPPSTAQPAAAASSTPKTPATAARTSTTSASSVRPRPTTARGPPCGWSGSRTALPTSTASSR